MHISQAEPEDIKPWLELAAEVEYLFGPMVNEPGFYRALEKNILRGSAYCVRENDGPPGTSLLGGILFSSKAPIYNIGWLSVASRSRNKGIASKLIQRVLATVKPPAEVTVTTFGEDIPDGAAARMFYIKHGFVPSNSAPPGPEGGSRQVFRLIKAAGDAGGNRLN